MTDKKSIPNLTPAQAPRSVSNARTKMLVVDTKEVTPPATPTGEDCVPGEVKDMSSQLVLLHAPTVKRAFAHYTTALSRLRGGASKVSPWKKGRGGARGMGRGMRIPNFSAWVVLSYVSTSGSTAAQAPVVTLNIGTSASIGEMTNFAGIFDFMRVTDMKIQNLIEIAATNTTKVRVGVAFDPANAGAFTSAVGTELTTQHKFWVCASAATEVETISRNGLQMMRVKMPQGQVPITTAGVTTLVGGGWVPTSAANAIVGYLKSYVEASTVGATILTQDVFYRIEFKSRT